MLQRPVLERNHLIHRNWYYTTSVAYREAILELDELVAVVGVREPDPDLLAGGMYREGSPTRLRLTGSARFRC